MNWQFFFVVHSLIYFRHSLTLFDGSLPDIQLFYQMLNSLLSLINLTRMKTNFLNTLNDDQTFFFFVGFAHNLIKKNDLKHI